MSSSLKISGMDIDSPVFADYLNSHKVKHSFNARARGVPDIIFLLERHRGGYDPMLDRQQNDRIIDAFYTEKSVVLVEKPEGELITETTAYARTEHWTVSRRVEGCFDKKHLEASDRIFESFRQLSWIDQGIQEEHSQLLESLIISTRVLYDKIVLEATQYHAEAIIRAIRRHADEGPIFVVIGKNHASFPKKDKKFSRECRESVQKVHDFLAQSGKWAVILTPKKSRL